MRKAERIKKVDGQCPMVIPGNFDPAAILSGINKRPQALSTLKDCFYFILHSLLTISELRSDITNDYIPLQSKILNSICGKNYKVALDLLVDNGIIDCDSSYQVGHYSKGYRISANYVGGTVKYRELKGATIRKKYIDYKNALDTKNKISLAGIPYIVKWFNPDLLKINIENTHRFVEFYKSKMVKLLDSNRHRFTEVEQKTIVNRITQKTNNAIISITKIDKGLYGLHRNGKDNRLHHAIANLKKELRAFLTYDGEKLVGLDITASQPFLLTRLVSKSFYIDTAYNKPNLLTVYKDLHNIITQQHSDIIMFVSSIDSVDNQQNKTHRFSDINWSRDFYNDLMALEGALKSGKRSFNNRNITKKSVLLILYDKKNGNKNGASVFKELFPAETQLIRMFNSIAGESYLPILLQRLESCIMLDHVCKTISQELPEAPIIPVHDCIYTTEKYSEQVMEIMRSNIHALTGFVPGIKKDYDTDLEVLQALNEIAKEDFKAIIMKNITNKKRKKEIITDEPYVHLKAPILQLIPKLNSEQIISTRYVDTMNPDDDCVSTEI